MTGRGEHAKAVGELQVTFERQVITKSVTPGRRPGDVTVLEVFKTIVFAQRTEIERVIVEAFPE